MKIEGLASKIVRDRAGELSLYYPVGAGHFKRLEFRKAETKSSYVQYVEGNEHPDLGPGELLSITLDDDAITERMIRAMAYIHLGVEEATTGYSSCDAAMIRRGFGIGNTMDRQPIWFKSSGDYYIVIGKSPQGGLPSLVSEPASVIFGVPDRTSVTAHAESLEAILKMLDTGQLPSLLDPLADVEIDGVYTLEGKTLH